MAKKLNQISSFPQINVALSGWQQVITLIKTIQSIVDGDNSETTISKTFKGVMQPLSVEQIQLKPEGDRSWKWYQVHSYTGDLDLTTNDIVTFDSIKYKIMAVFDYSLNGFIEYHCIKDFQ